MRDIKFRIWFTEVKEMVYLPVMSLCGEYTSLSFYAAEDSEYSGIMRWPEYEANLDRDTGQITMQYTGLKDKNGMEIYEGDIVEGQDFYNAIEFRGVIKFGGGSFYSSDSVVNRYRLLEYGLEVIGNIYENTELLEK